MARYLNRVSLCIALSVVGSLLANIAATSAQTVDAPPQSETSGWNPVPVVMRVPPFAEAGKMMRYDYIATGPATKSWRLCVSVPRADFELVAAVIHGIRSEAVRKGASVTVVDSGAENIDRQRTQIAECLDTSDAVIVMGAGRKGLEPVFRIAHERGIPIINAGIETAGKTIDARIVPSALAIGEALGNYLAQRFPEGSDTAHVAWFPGPADSGFAAAYDAGFRHGLKRSQVDIVGVGFTGLDEQSLRRALSDLLDEDEPLQAVAGVGLMIPVALEALSGAQDTTILLSTSITDEIVDAISDLRVAAAVNSRPVDVGRIAADLAIRALEGRPFMRDVYPRVELVDEASLSQFDRASAFVPEP